MHWEAFDAAIAAISDAIIAYTTDGSSVTDLISPVIKKIKQGYNKVIVSRDMDEVKS